MWISQDQLNGCKVEELFHVIKCFVIEQVVWKQNLTITYQTL